MGKTCSDQTVRVERTRPGEGHLCRDFGQAGLPLLSVPWGPCSPFPWTGLLLGPCPWLRSRLPACLLSRGRFVVQPARLQLGPVPDTLLLPVTQGPSPCASFFTLVKSEVPSRPHPPSGASRPLLPGWARWILYSQDAAFHCVPSTWVHFGAGQLSRLLSSLSPRETHTEQNLCRVGPYHCVPLKPTVRSFQPSPNPAYSGSSQCCQVPVCGPGIGPVLLECSAVPRGPVCTSPFGTSWESGSPGWSLGLQAKEAAGRSPEEERCLARQCPQGPSGGAE